MCRISRVVAHGGVFDVSMAKLCATALEQCECDHTMNPPLRKTRRTYNEPGHAHFLTYSCFQRMPLLIRDRARRWVVEAMAVCHCS